MLADIQRIERTDPCRSSNGQPGRRTFSRLRDSSVLRTPPASSPSDSRQPDQPAPQQEWKQTHSVPTRTIGEDVLLELVRPQERRSLVTGTQFLPVLDSPSADVRGSIVFVGYGIADPSRGVGDYAGVDVRNKIVLFLRGKPDRYTAAVAQADKERVAKEKGRSLSPGHWAHLNGL